jgi:hypothetical protein
MNEFKEATDYVTLKEFLLDKIISQDKVLTTALEGQARALTVALKAHQDSVNVEREQLEKRLQGLNEFRMQLKDQTATFITKNEHELLISQFNDRMCAVTETYDRRIDEINKAREDLKAQHASFVPRPEWSSITKKHDDEIKELERAKNIAEGKASMSQVYVSWIIAGISLLTSVITLILMIKN